LGTIIHAPQLTSHDIPTAHTVIINIDCRAVCHVLTAVWWQLREGEYEYSGNHVGVGVGKEGGSDGDSDHELRMKTD
jgi:hypothetical protein